MYDLDLTWMDLALAEAERGRGAVEPNPMVGAVIVRDGKVVGRGHHARFGGPHAEVMALREARAAARGATLYVTLEPCCHHGKTPPCTDAIRCAGLARVVIAIRDPFPRVDGGGLATLRAAGIQVELGLRADAAARLNAPFLKRVVTGLPYVTAKWAMTLDGKTAVATGDSQWISSARSRSLVHQKRGQMDAIVVGIGTVLADDPLLTARPEGPRTAARVVLDSKARLPLDSRLVMTAREVPVIVAVTEQAPEHRRLSLAEQGCEILSMPGTAPCAAHALAGRTGPARDDKPPGGGGGQSARRFPGRGPRRSGRRLHRPDSRRGRSSPDPGPGKRGSPHERRPPAGGGDVLRGRTETCGSRASSSSPGDPA